MRDLRVAIVQFSPKLGDVRANAEAHEERIERARGERADLVVFPELSLTGYDLQDIVPDVACPRDGEPLRRLARAAPDLDLVVGFVEETPGHRYHNATAYLSRGTLVHVHRKLFLPTYGLFQEGREFAAGDTLRAFVAPHGPMAMLICEDAWHAPTSWIACQQGADLLVVPANGPVRGASPGEGITSVAAWRELAHVTARLHTVFVVFVNRVGCEDGLTFGGGSTVVDPSGRPLLELAALDEDLGCVDLSAESLRGARIRSPFLRDARLELVHREIERLHRLRFELAPEPAGPAPGLEDPAAVPDPATPPER